MQLFVKLSLEVSSLVNKRCKNINAENTKHLLNLQN